MGENTQIDGNLNTVAQSKAKEVKPKRKTKKKANTKIKRSDNIDLSINMSGWSDVVYTEPKKKLDWNPDDDLDSKIKKVKEKMTAMFSQSKPAKPTYLKKLPSFSSDDKEDSESVLITHSFNYDESAELYEDIGPEGGVLYDYSTEGSYDFDDDHKYDLRKWYDQPDSYYY